MQTASEPRLGLFIGSTTRELKFPREMVAKNIRVAVQDFIAATMGGEDGSPFPVPAIPLGETEDPNWVDRQLKGHDNISALRRVKGSKFGKTLKYKDMPHYMVRKGRTIDPEEMNFFFADRVRTGLPILKEVAEECGIKTPRIQVGINTIDLAVFALKLSAPKHMGAYFERTRMETQEIWEKTNGRAFFLIEIPTIVILSILTRGKPELLSWYIDMLLELLDVLPEGAAWGFHFCDGRLGGKAVEDTYPVKLFRRTAPLERFQIMVDMSNEVLRVLEAAGFVPEVAQYPFVHGSRRASLNAADYVPFGRLFVPRGTQVVAGAIGPHLTLKEHEILFAILDAIFERRVGMSNSCGYGSDDRKTMLHYMRVMNHLAYV